MPAEFDAYHKWLGISPREQPPTYYRLLAIDLFEDDPEVIDSAANRQMTYLQDLASGPNVKQAQKLLNEIAAARLCLLDTVSKAEYDAQLNVAASSAGPALAAPAGVVETSASNHQTARGLRSPNPTATKPPARPTQSPARPPSASLAVSPSLDFSSPDEPVRRPTKRRKQSSNSLIFALLGAVAVVAVVAAVIASGALSPVDRSTSTDGAASDGRVAPGSDDDAIPDPGADFDRTNLQHGSSIGAPGGDATPDLVQDRQPPPAITPASNGGAAAQKPDLLVRAEAALDRNDVNRSITLLKEFLAGKPPARWQPNAQQLLRQATAATNNEAIARAARQAVNQLSDDEARKVVSGKPHPWRLQFPFEMSQITDPRLKKVLAQNITHQLSLAMTERMNGKPREDPPTSPPTSPPKEEPKPDLATKEEQKPEVEPPVVSDERPTDPAKLLAYVGLARFGQRWSLRAEDPLREDLQQANALYKKLNDARRQIPTRKREQLAAMKRQVDEEEHKIQAKQEEWVKKGSVLKSEVDQWKKFEEEVKGRRATVEAAEAKVSEVDQAMLKTREELEKLLVGMVETMDELRVNYEVLGEDAEVLAAIKSQGGALAASSMLKTSRARLARMQRDLKETAL